MSCNSINIVFSHFILLILYMSVHGCLQAEVQQQHMRQQQVVQAEATVPDRSLTPVQVHALLMEPSYVDAYIIVTSQYGTLC